MRNETPENPYSSPEAVDEPRGHVGEPAEQVHVAIAYAFHLLRPWTLACAICCAVATFILGVIVIFMIALQSPDSIVSGFVFGVIAFVLAIAGMLLLRISRSMKYYVSQPSEMQLEFTLRQQNSFWMYCGLTMGVVTALYAFAALITLLDVLRFTI